MVQRVAVAGSTGYIGQRILEWVGYQPLWDGRALVRPGSEHKVSYAPGQDMVVCGLDDVQALTVALAGCKAVIQTVGTTRAQFGPGISYETVDYGTTVALIAAAQAAGVQRFILISSAGAGQAVGSYLQWKARTEAVVRASGLHWTILRPSMVVGPYRRLMYVLSLPLVIASKIPGIAAFGLKYRPIHVNAVAQACMNCLDSPQTYGHTLEGETLWNIL